MSRAAGLNYSPFQVLQRFVFSGPREIYYIGGQMSCRRLWSRRERHMS